MMVGKFGRTLRVFTQPKRAKRTVQAREAGDSVLGLNAIARFAGFKYFTL